uniref:Uncharacterized protein n=1 Tax=Oryzias sinensis TaxID=183150 RepID=A0A8C7Y8V5_9TELE
MQFVSLFVTREKKISELFKSQPKVYNTFADELADYIQVQKARGIAPKTSQGLAQGDAAKGDQEEEAQEESENWEMAGTIPNPPHPPSVWSVASCISRILLKNEGSDKGGRRLKRQRRGGEMRRRRKRRRKEQAVESEDEGRRKKQRISSDKKQKDKRQQSSVMEEEKDPHLQTTEHDKQAKLKYGKERKKTKDKPDRRTEEEKLWDDSILGC